MRIINLMEDTKGCESCVYEHGLSFYMETEKHKMLLDFGASEATLANAKALGIDLTQVDLSVLSHGHYDHSGGIIPFTKINPTAEIYLQKTALGDYYNLSNGEKYIGIDKAIAKLPQAKIIEGNLKIDSEIELFTNITGRRFFARGNQVLKRKDGENYVQDDFRHEQCAVIHQDSEHILFSGCAHNGILNILDEYKRLYNTYPTMVISGFHMMQKEYTQADIETIQNIARELITLPTKFYTGHCTGKTAFDIMKEIMGEQIVEIRCGVDVL
jgi:7,8-dihydropterin-6-yl-methyl-4-(beta-D-ribofuranosyl)aminobenzene 5'-phosphate synthase